MTMRKTNTTRFGAEELIVSKSVANRVYLCYACRRYDYSLDDILRHQRKEHKFTGEQLWAYFYRSQPMEASLI